MTSFIAFFKADESKRGWVLPPSVTGSQCFFALKTDFISPVYAVMQASTSICKRPSMMAINLRNVNNPNTMMEEAFLYEVPLTRLCLFPR